MSFERQSSLPNPNPFWPGRDAPSIKRDFNIAAEAGEVLKVVKRFPAVVNSSTLEIHFYWAGKGTTGIPIRGVYGLLISAISVNPDFIPPSGKGASISVSTVVGILVAAGSVVVLVLGIFWWKCCVQKKYKTDLDLKSLDLRTGSFTLRQIRAATNNFDVANKIGEGGFGPVYKGLLLDGTLSAVKQLSSKSKQGNREFVNEIGMIFALQHPNLVKLYDCCIKGNQSLLVHEYMENKSLARALFGLKEFQLKLDWSTRHKICTGIAKGLAYQRISQASSVIGGFLADAYLGRYWTIAIFSTIHLVGLTGITLCATMNVLVPNQDDCSQFSLLLGNCESAKPWQMFYLYTVLYITGFGAAGIRPCVSSFGADQFDERSKNYKSHLDRYFDLFYLCVTVGAIVAFTAVVYIQIKKGWGFAFGTLAIAMGISNMLFFLGTPLYRHRLPGGSPLTRVAQVLVAAFRKRHVSFDTTELIGLYENRSAIKGSTKIPHTDEYECLDKTALQLKDDGGDYQVANPWHLCTVTQVEEVKILIKLLPVTDCTIMLSLILTEFLTLSVQQAYTLNTYMGRLKLPVTCMLVFPGLGIFLLLSLYYSVFVPLSKRITGHPHGASQLQRVGIGLGLSILSVAWDAVFETYRRNYSIEHGYEASLLTFLDERGITFDLEDKVVLWERGNVMDWPQVKWAIKS